MTLRSLALLTILGSLWGASFAFIKLGLESYAPATVVAIRLLGAGLVLYAVMRWQGHTLPRTRQAWRDMFVVGLVGLVLPFTLISWGEQYIDSSLAAIIIATTPLFTLLLAYFISREESLNWLRSLGVLVGFSGVLVAIGFNAETFLQTSTLGKVAIMGAALCYSFVALYARRAFRGGSPLVSATGTMFTGTLCIVPLALLFDGLPTLEPTRMALLGVVGLTLLSTVLAYIIYYWLLETIGAPRTTMVTYLIPSFALVYGWLLLNEQIGVNTVAGLLLVFAGIVLANGQFVRRRAVAGSS